MNTFCEMNKNQFNSRLKFTNPKKWNNITKKIRSIETRKKDNLMRTFDFFKNIAKEDMDYYSNLIKTDIDQMKELTSRMRARFLQATIAGAVGSIIFYYLLLNHHI